MTKAEAVAVALFVTLLSSPLFTMVTMAQPSQGNWIITGTQVVQNESITLNGNLTIESGGNLTLRNVKLTINAMYTGEYGISVQPGGSMYVYNSTIRPSKLSVRFSFVAQGSSFVMKNSKLQGVGWCTTNLNSCGNGAQGPNEGLTVMTNNAVLKKDLFSNNLIGLVLEASYATVSNNNFTANDVSVLDLMQSNHDKITGNYFDQGPPYYDQWESYISNSNNNLFYNNTMTSVPGPVINGHWLNVGGFVMYGSSNNIFHSNSLFDSQPIAGVGSCGGGCADSNTTIQNNRIIVEGDQAIRFVGGAYTRLIGNSITMLDKPYQIPEHVGGIILESSPDSTVANNSLLGSGQWLNQPLALIHSPGSYILNNNFSVTFPPAGGCNCEDTPAVQLYDSYNVTMKGNIVNGGMGEGIWLASGSDNVTVSDNVVGSVNPPQRSIVIDASSHDHVYGNSFYDQEGPYDNGTKNAWVGNYWNYWRGTGAFRIPVNGIDLKPAAAPLTLRLVPVIAPLERQIPRVSGQALKLNVNGNETMANLVETISAGSIYIGTGGTLTIYKSTLTLGPSFVVIISPGGTLIVNDSTLLGLNQINEQTEKTAGGNLTVTHSKLLVGQNETFVLTFSGGVDIRDSVIESVGPFGFLIQGQGGANTSLSIENSLLEGGSFTWGGYGSINSGAGVLTMSNVTMTYSFCDVSFSGQSATITHSSFIGAGWGMTIDAIKGTFSDNHIIDQPAVNPLPPGVLQSNNLVVYPTPLTAPPDPSTNGVATTTTISTSSMTTQSTSSSSTSSSTTRISSSTTPITTGVGTVTTTSSVSTSQATTTTNGSIPEFPYQLLAVAAVTVVILVSFVFLRHRNVRTPSRASHSSRAPLSSGKRTWIVNLG